MGYPPGVAVLWIYPGSHPCLPPAGCARVSKPRAKLAISIGVAVAFCNRLGVARTPHPALPQGSPVPLFFKWEALRTKVAPLLTATLASLSLPDFAWFLPLEGSPWCLSRAGLRLLLSLLLVPTSAQACPDFC